MTEDSDVCCSPTAQHLHPVSNTWTTPSDIMKETRTTTETSFWCFLLYQNTKFERKISDGTKHWGWYGDMDTTLLPYSHRHVIHWAQSMCWAPRLHRDEPAEVKPVRFAPLQKACDGDGVRPRCYQARVINLFPPLTSQLLQVSLHSTKRNESHGRASGVWVRHDLRW